MKIRASLATALVATALASSAHADTEPARTDLRVASAVLGGLATASVVSGAFLFDADTTGKGWGGVGMHYGGALLLGFGIATGSASISVLGASFAEPSAKRALVVSGAVVLGLGVAASMVGALFMGNRDASTFATGLTAAGLGVGGAGAGLLTSGLRF